MTADNELICTTLKSSTLLSKLHPSHVDKVASMVQVIRHASEEVIIKAGEESSSFFLVAQGEVSILSSTTAAPYELCRLGSPESVGELGLLLNTPRSATVVAATDVVLLSFRADVFTELFAKVPDFGITVSRSLAQRLEDTSRLVELPTLTEDYELPDPEVFNLLPAAFITRHRLVPLRTEGKVITLGCVHEPTETAIQSLKQHIPGMEITCVSIHANFFERALKSLSGATTKAPPPPAPTTAGAPTPAASLPPGDDVLDGLLRRMVEEGASDLHLSAGHKPRWRIDGEIFELRDGAVLDPDAVFEMLRPKMRQASVLEFEETNDCDFAYAIEGVARFRVNLFRDRLGTGSVLRQIPDTVLTLEQLGMPEVVGDFCNLPKGLLLVTGPTGSGKSTTLAAMVDRINREKSVHIITLEDPIEFVHKSQKSLVNQREVGVHTSSFSRALKAALREDPEIILVGEMRDKETVSLALEAANTGHLVLGTLHTSTAVGTIDRVVDLFPATQQSQVRSGLADTLRGVLAQTLCKRISGGRVAALEILIGNHAVSSLIREGKSQQIPNIMVTGRADGNQLLNQELKRLVDKQFISPDEAMSRAIDKKDLAKALGKTPTRRR